MEDEQPIAEQETPPAVPLPPGARRSRKQAPTVDAAATVTEVTPPPPAPEPDRPAGIFINRADHFAKLAEGTARAMLAVEGAHRLAQQLQAVVDAYNPEELNLAPEHKVVADQSIDRLYSTAGQLDALLDLISRIIGSEWSIYSTIYPPYQGGA